MNKKEIKKALDFENKMYVISFSLSLVSAIIIVIFSVLKNNVFLLIIGVIFFLMMYLALKRAFYLEELGESIK